MITGTHSLKRLPFPLRRIVLELFTTFRGRLALLYIAIEFALLLFAGVLLYIVLTRQVYNAVDEQLHYQAATIASELQASPFPFWGERLGRFSEHFNGAVQLVGANGLPLFTSQQGLIGRGGSEVTQALQRAMEGETAFVSTRSLLRRDNMRIIAIPIKRGNEVVAVLFLGRNTREIHDFFGSLYLIGGILGLISMIISAYAGYVMAQRALQPIREITAVARAVAAGDLSRRLRSFSQDKEIAVLIRSLNKMFQDLEASFESQKRFTADASHELRIPLTVMKGEIEVTLRRQRKAAEYAEVLRQQLSTIERMERIVDGLLTLARADAGLLELHKQAIDIGQLVREVGEKHVGLFASKHVHLRIRADHGLEVLGDHDRLQQVVFNLLNNAYKYAPEKSEVVLVCEKHGDQACIQVQDQGPGIPEQHLPHIFEPFYRPDSARSRSQGGAGLGLAICKRIVDVHGGHIEVESKEGAGTRFLVYIPLYIPEHTFRRRLREALEKSFSKRAA